jgi:hypothetical protein
MSLYTPRPSNADQPLFAKGDHNASQSEEVAGSAGGPTADISAAQKMISATWGSILTSLLGAALQILISAINSTR